MSENVLDLRQERLSGPHNNLSFTWTSKRKKRKKLLVQRKVVGPMKASSSELKSKVADLAVSLFTASLAVTGMLGSSFLSFPFH